MTCVAEVSIYSLKAFFRFMPVATMAFQGELAGTWANLSKIFEKI
jgi:hypothetical protein